MSEGSSDYADWSVWGRVTECHPNPKKKNATPASMGHRPPAFAFVSFEHFDDAKDAVAGRGQ